MAYFHEQFLSILPDPRPGDLPDTTPQRKEIEAPIIDPKASFGALTLAVSLASAALTYSSASSAAAGPAGPILTAAAHTIPQALLHGLVQSDLAQGHSGDDVPTRTREEKSTEEEIAEGMEEASRYLKQGQLFEALQTLHAVFPLFRELPEAEQGEYWLRFRETADATLMAVCEKTLTPAEYPDAATLGLARKLARLINASELHDFLA